MGGELSSDAKLTLGVVRSLVVLGVWRAGWCAGWLGVLLSADGRLLLLLMTRALLGPGLGRGTARGHIVTGWMRRWVQRDQVRPTISADVQNGLCLQILSIGSQGL